MNKEIFWRSFFFKMIFRYIINDSCQMVKRDYSILVQGKANCIK